MATSTSKAVLVSFLPTGDQTLHLYEFDLKWAGTLMGGFAVDQERVNKHTVQTERWHQTGRYLCMCLHVCSGLRCMSTISWGPKDPVTLQDQRN